ncbi:hypothetical protein RFEPED_0320 [Rickettsia felis str. Pedreira]|uniref:Uncharacterized protein n=1 Tax=Rickettsia felis str. Pedreira TaxID=1359196 RepID=A0A0F3MTM3_RICFI|nr:hypothetical protein RFEPED_0320 [Rickettsia felis str. Pedreira]
MSFENGLSKKFFDNIHNSNSKSSISKYLSANKLQNNTFV